MCESDKTSMDEYGATAGLEDNEAVVSGEESDEDNEVKEENIRLRKENLFLQLLSSDVFEKVVQNLHLNEDKNTSELCKEFNDKFNFDGFCQAYHEYVQEHHQNEKYPDFDDYDWEYFWKNYDECVERVRYADVDWKNIFQDQIDRCRRCGCEYGCECSEESDEDNEAGAGGE